MIAFARVSTVSEGRETESLLLLFGLLELLDVDGLLHLLASSYRGLDEGLTGTKCAHSTGLLKLSLESSQSLLDVFALFYWNYDHNVLLIYFVVILSIAGRVLHTLSSVRKITNTLANTQTPALSACASRTKISHPAPCRSTLGI